MGNNNEVYIFNETKTTTADPLILITSCASTNLKTPEMSISDIAKPADPFFASHRLFMIAENLV